MTHGSSDDDIQEATPAATVVLLRSAPVGFELLLVQRAAELAYHGGAWVFPGGRVETADREGSPDEIAVARKAAIREAAEEAGLALSAENLLPLAHWTTPKGRARCFATWFFLAGVTASDVRVDGREIKNHLWTTPAEALALRAAGELVLPAPTFVTLVGLSAYADRSAAMASTAERVPEVFLPRPHQVAGGVCSLYGGDVAYGDGDIDRPGPRHRLWMLDRGWRYERSHT
jgi:8-oxo-dGTP pyrophosphatase MutT (NUDIX family)